MIRVEVRLLCEGKVNEHGAPCLEQLRFTRADRGGLSVNEAVQVATRVYGWQASTAAAPTLCPKHRGRHPNAHTFEPGGFDGKACDAHPKGRGCWLPATHYIHAEGPELRT